MTQSVVTFEKIREPTVEFAELNQTIGHEAWMTARGIRRSPEEIRMMFAPNNERGERAFKRNAHRNLNTMKDRASEGEFLGVVALKHGNPIGYTWAADDMSGSKTQKAAKRKMGRKPYVWIPQVNVLPEDQGVGIGTQLVDEALADFDPTKQSTIYVFDENQNSLRWARNMGYRPNPDTPTQTNRYFSQAYPPVEQWRLVQSIATIRETIAGLQQK